MLPEGFIPEQLSSPDAIELRGFEEMVREVASRVPSEPAGLMDNGQGSESEDNGEALVDEGRGCNLRIANNSRGFDPPWIDDAEMDQEDGLYALYRGGAGGRGEFHFHG